MSKVAVIGTGGTISSVGRDPFDQVNYTDTKRKYDAAELVDWFSEVRDAAEVVPVPFRAVSSTAVGTSEWLELVRLISELTEKDPALDGIVVTHGTATLEETAYFLNLTVKTDVPVVMVGAQRPASAFGADGGMNLYNAIRVAGSREARGLGVLVVLNDEIQAAREVTKTSTYRLQTFRTPDFGVLGHADGDGSIAIYRHPTRRHAPDTEFDVGDLTELPRVDILASYAGSDGVAVDAYLAAGARGIVSAGMAPGSGTPDDVAALGRAIEQGVVVVQSTRAGSGRVLTGKTPSVKGSVAGDNLNPQKARILLMLALTRSNDAADIQRMFATY
ncbi:MAG: asparaginase [Rhodospirillaceae bacterium]|jgi:L-asparaginase|nr:asparaginase [Rhodospirillaceae bacterium]MBT5665665.1 asparaginase [Rhodospirillaceae bacterium]MBT5812414.1 asparaginase [Rhodospirillaceae bacterium]